MALPRKLKNMMLFNEGASYIGEIASVTIPKLTRKLEDWRAGGMDQGVKIDMGAEPLEAMEWEAGGPLRDVIRQFGIMNLAGVYLRWVGAFQNDATGELDQIEVIVRGRHEEIEFGEQKVGEGGGFKVKTVPAYLKIDWNGVTELEIDPLAMVLVVGGVDRLADQRAALGI